MEERDNAEVILDESEEQTKNLQENYIRTDAEIAKQIAQRRVQQLITKTIEGQTEKALRTTARQPTKGAMVQAVKQTTGKAAAETGKKAVSAAVRQTTQTAASKTAKTAVSFAVSSSASTVGTASGAAVGVAGGIPGMLIGAGVGNIFGKSAEAGTNVVSQQTNRFSRWRKSMLDAMKQGQDPKTLKHMMKSLAADFMATVRNAVSIQSLANAILPGFSVVVIVLFLLITFIVTFVIMTSVLISILVSIIVPIATQEAIGQLAGGQEVVYYCQYEDPWADYAYGDSTISVCGCGPSTMAIVVSTLTDQVITPIDAADYATEHDFYFNGVGTMWSYFVRGAEGYGLTSVNHGDDLMAALECIPEGGMVVITVGTRDGTGNELYRGNGHFMAIRGITEEGKILVADPASRANSEAEWDYQTVTEILKNCWSITYTAPEEPELSDEVVHGEQNKGGNEIVRY